MIIDRVHIPYQVSCTRTLRPFVLTLLLQGIGLMVTTHTLNEITLQCIRLQYLEYPQSEFHVFANAHTYTKRVEELSVLRSQGIFTEHTHLTENRRSEVYKCINYSYVCISGTFVFSHILQLDQFCQFILFSLNTQSTTRVCVFSLLCCIEVITNTMYTQYTNETK